MTMDNGAPWGYSGDQQYTTLNAWLIRLGIKVYHSRPRHPQTQGKLERLHRTLKEELLSLVRVQPGMPRDVRDIILCSTHDLKKECMLVWYYDLCHGNALTGFQMRMLKKSLLGYVMELLKTHLKKHYGKAVDSESQTILNPDALETNFDKAIRDNISERLGLLQQKAHKNASVNIEKEIK